MNYSSFLRSLCLLLALSPFVNLARSSSAVPQATPDFSGNWVLKLGSRVFIAVTVTAASGVSGPFSGSVWRPKHFSINGAAMFSHIQGPVVNYPIVHSSVNAECASFTTQNPADQNDTDTYRLCLTGDGHATLGFDAPGIEPWPVSREDKLLPVAADWDNGRAYFLDDTDVSNPEMQRIFDADQKDRQPDAGKIDWNVVSKADAARRESTRKLLAEGRLHTGEDFERAAFAFQHGDASDDYLLAHTLAMVAAARGQASAIWIAAATLDRYLNSIHQPQIYGTQFFLKTNQPTTQEPYNRSLISDALRKQLGVPSEAAQEEQRKQYDAERSKN
jgi:hypothetical protein